MQESNWKTCSVCGLLLRGVRAEAASARLTAHMRTAHPTGTFARAQRAITPQPMPPDVSLSFADEGELAGSGLLVAADWIRLPDSPRRGGNDGVGDGRLALGDTLRVLLTVGERRFRLSGMVTGDSDRETPVFVTAATPQPDWSNLAASVLGKKSLHSRGV